MVRELFKTEPDRWQEEALEAFPTSRRIAMRACVGPGKTAVLAWLGWNFMLTRPHPKIGATSISGANLKSNLWAELARWYHMSDLLKSQFEFTKSVIYCRQFPETWTLEARTWPKDADATQIGNALAGMHAKHIMWLLDETGDYPESIMPVCEGIFSGDPEEAHIVQAGNPTKLGGPLYRAYTAAADLWKKITITADPDDPMRTPRVSVEIAREQIKQYGRDNPWILVRIFGQFPPSNINSLIGPDEIDASFKRTYTEYDIGGAPRVLGVDVARYGDDASVIFRRQGLQAFKPDMLRNANSLQGAGRVARVWDDWGADACFVDATGGFGAGWIDQLIQLGKAPFGVQYAGEAHEKDRYYNKRTEMYFDAVDWIKRGGALAESAGLLAAMTQITYTIKGNRLLLEPKELIKARIQGAAASGGLDESDAFVQTFAEPVVPKNKPRRTMQKQQEYNPFAEPNSIAAAVDQSYDPFR
jgi:hypothetical protein